MVAMKSSKDLRGYRDGRVAPRGDTNMDRLTPRRGQDRGSSGLGTARIGFARLFVIGAAAAVVTVAAAAAVTVAAAAVLTMAAATPARACALRVGWTPWTPYMDRTADGGLVGIDIDATRAIAAAAGCTVAFVEGEWSRLLYEVEHGRLDALPGASRTDARARYAVFGTPYRDEAMRLFVRADDAASLAAPSLAAFVGAGRRIGIVRDNYFGPEVARLASDPATADRFALSQSSHRDLRRMVRGRIDGVIVDHATGVLAARTYDLRDRIAVHPMPVHATRVFLMLSRTTIDETLAARIDHAIATVREAGRFAAIIDRYLGP